MAHGKIVSISGPLIIAENLPDAKMYEVVRIGDEKLFGEIIEMHGKQVFIQCYEETLGLRPGEIVKLEGFPLSVQLGPGLITSIYDGVQRPLEHIYDKYRAFIARGIDVAPLPYNKEWHFFPLKEKGEKVSEGEKLGYVQETPSLKHYLRQPRYNLHRLHTHIDNA